MNQNEFDKQNSFMKKYFYNIDFNILYSNFENLFNEYSESEIINIQINGILDKYFQLKKDEEIKLEFNIDFFKNINIDNLIEAFNNEKIGKRDKFISDITNNTLIKNIVTPKNFLYTRNILIFIMLKYYKQFAADIDKNSEEKLYKVLMAEMNLRENVNKNESLNIFSNHIISLYKTFARKYVVKKDDNNNQNNNAAYLNNNLNDEFNNFKSNSPINNIIIIPESNNSNNLNNEIYINNPNPKEDSQIFFGKFFGFLISKNPESNRSNNLQINFNDGNFNSKINLIIN